MAYISEIFDQTDDWKKLAGSNEDAISQIACLKKYIEAATRCIVSILDGTFTHTPHPEILNPNDFIQEFIRRQHLDRKGSPVQIQANLDENLLPVLVDPVLLDVALSNLVSDAINHRPNNTVVIETASDGDSTSIYVISGVPGEDVEPIPGELLDVIGRRVYSTSEATPEKPFRGYGKVSTRNFCLNSGGEFTVENREGRPCLGIHFPVYRGEPEQMRDAA
ncbi:MAG: ATP-binding protein [Methanobacteriota archaeon]